MPQQPALCLLLCPACWAPICPRALATRGQCQWLLQGVQEVPQGGSRIRDMLTYCRACFQSAPLNLVGTIHDHLRGLKLASMQKNVSVCMCKHAHSAQ